MMGSLIFSERINFFETEIEPYLDVYDYMHAFMMERGIR
jgi:hypothetical protein